MHTLPSHSHFKTSMNVPLADISANMRSNLENQLAESKRQLNARMEESQNRLNEIMDSLNERKVEMQKKLQKNHEELEQKFKDLQKSQQQKLDELSRKYSHLTIIPKELVLLHEKKDELDMAEKILTSFKTDKWEMIPIEQQEKKLHALQEIKEAIKSGDTLTILMKRFLKISHNVRYYKGISSDRAEIEKLEELYRSNWSHYDPEWTEHLVHKLRESLDDDHSFSLLRFQDDLWYVSHFDSNNISWFLRVTPYKKSQTDRYAKYLWAVNIKEGLQGFSFLRYMLQRAFERIFISSSEVYLHAVPGTDSEKIWFSMGFEDRWIIQAPYGKNSEKSQPLRLMCLTRDIYKKTK